MAHRGEHRLEQPPDRRAEKPPMTIPGPKIPPDPPDPMDSPVARIRAKGTISTIHNGIDPARYGSGLLHPAVPRADDLGNGDADRPDGEAAEGRSDPAGQRRAPEEIRQAVEALGVQEPDQPGEQPDEGEPEQLDGVGEAVVPT